MPTLRFSARDLAREAAENARRAALAPAALARCGEPEYGCTAREEVWRDGDIVLYRFKGEGRPTRTTPLLICYALVNRPYMVDLQEDRSLVRNLMARGHDVYLIDWGYPGPGDRWRTLDDYVLRYLGGAVAALSARARGPVDLLGICQGGTFSLCFAALEPTHLRRLITMVAPVDFHTDDNLLGLWTRELDVDAFVEAHGNIPGDLMNWAYLMLKPWRLMMHKYVALTDVVEDARALENFLRMERWIFDSPDQAGEAFRQFVQECYQRNALVKGQLSLGGRKVKLSDIRLPILNIVAEQDHLVPPSASRPLRRHVGSRDYSELSFPGGHIGIYVSGKAQREVPAAIDQWLRSGR
jgi:polyhydroxyalkanoate synthase